MKILIAEDNNNLRELMYDYLTANNFEVDAYSNGLEALAGFKTHNYDFALLDVMMPEMDGFTLCKKIKEQENLPVLFLTAKVTEEDQLHGYEVGCDDYIIKPFSLPVLLAKIRVMAKKQHKDTNILTCGVLSLDTAKQQVYLHNKEVKLKALDYKLLELFMHNPDRVLTREQILLKVWGYEYEGNDRSVDTHVKNLRKALAPYNKCIRTVIKTGYQLETKVLEVC